MREILYSTMLNLTIKMDELLISSANNGNQKR